MRCNGNRFPLLVNQDVKGIMDLSDLHYNDLAAPIICVLKTSLFNDKCTTDVYYCYISLSVMSGLIFSLHSHTYQMLVHHTHRTVGFRHRDPLSSTCISREYSSSSLLKRSIEDDGYLNSNSDARQRNKNSILSTFLNRFKDTQPGTLILVRHGTCHFFAIRRLCHSS
jgi:hypothetical protein